MPATITGMNAPLPAHVVAELRVDGAPLSAASGLVRIGDALYVVADDELQLAIFDLQGRAGRRLRLQAGELPREAQARKAAKPDFEALIAWPDGRLLALGSGSRPNRERGVWIDPSGAVPPQAVDLSRLHACLRRQFGDVNIEGGFIIDGELHLLQRGNTQHAVNACAVFDIPGVTTAPALRRVQRYELGLHNGVPLGFTDGAALPDGRWLFSAAAEDTTDAYRDGACAGSVIGLVDADGALRLQVPLDGAWKVEGLHAQRQDGGIDLLMVTDADDPAQPAVLLSAVLPVR